MDAVSTANAVLDIIARNPRITALLLAHVMKGMELIMDRKLLLLKQGYTVIALLIVMTVFQVVVMP